MSPEILSRILRASLLVPFCVIALGITIPTVYAGAQDEVTSPSLNLLGSRWNFVIHIRAQKDDETLNITPSDIDLIEGGGRGHLCYNDPTLPNTEPTKCDHLKVTPTPDNQTYIEVYVTRVNPTCVTYNIGGTWYSFCR
jgi:hypothetical protein